MGKNEFPDLSFICDREMLFAYPSGAVFFRVPSVVFHPAFARLSFLAVLERALVFAALESG